MLQPEIRAIQAKYKGNRAKISEETMRLYRERGVNPAAGCLPAFLQLFLLMPMYSVISQGLAAPDISSVLQFLGQPVLRTRLPGAGHAPAVHRPDHRLAGQPRRAPAGDPVHDPGASTSASACWPSSRPAAADPDADDDPADDRSAGPRAAADLPDPAACSRSSTARSCRRACSSTGSSSRCTRSCSNI